MAQVKGSPTLLPATFERHRVEYELMDTQRAVRASNGDPVGIGVEAQGGHITSAKVRRRSPRPAADVESGSGETFQEASDGARRSMAKALDVEFNRHAALGHQNGVIG